VGRHLVLTEAGRVAFRYAEKIFYTGSELLDALSGTNQLLHRLHIGIADSVPRLLVAYLLKGTVQRVPSLLPICTTGKHTELLTRLTGAMLDVVLTERPPKSSTVGQMYYHPLGEFPLAVYAARNFARQLRPRFPASLAGIPFLLPSNDSALRSCIERWCAEHNLTVRVAGEFEDSSLLKVYAESRTGVFVMPVVEHEELTKRYAVSQVGVLAGTQIAYYAVTLERRLKNQAIIALIDCAKNHSRSLPPVDS
jgi:LysR family transcriptional activator of nhaA